MMRTLVLVTMLAMLVGATVGVLPANASALWREPGPVGWRELPSFGSAYCDNFYDGPPMATTLSGAPLGGIRQQHVYWCYPENTGYWIPTSVTF
jgi:hypothetical protein